MSAWELTDLECWCTKANNNSRNDIFWGKDGPTICDFTIAFTTGYKIKMFLADYLYKLLLLFCFQGFALLKSFFPIMKTWHERVYSKVQSSFEVAVFQNLISKAIHNVELLINWISDGIVLITFHLLYKSLSVLALVTQTPIEFISVHMSNCLNLKYFFFWKVSKDRKSIFDNKC